MPNPTARPEAQEPWVIWDGEKERWWSFKPLAFSHEAKHAWQYTTEEEARSAAERLGNGFAAVPLSEALASGPPVEAQEPKPGEVWRNRDTGVEVNVVRAYGELGERMVVYGRPEWTEPLDMSLALWPSHYVRAATIRPVEVLPGGESEVDLAPLFADHADRPVLESYDLVRHLHRQRVFSRRTFGPGSSAARIIDHARKELVEIEADPTDLEEWIDLATLAFDGAWRQGYTSGEVAAALEAKLAKNERRKWPDWRTADPDRAIEHVRGGEPPNGGGDDE